MWIVPIILGMRKKILLVDDNEELRKLIKEQLEETANFEVVEARDGLEALSLFRFQSIDLVISDIDMPNKSGIELLKDIHLMKPSFPVILITGGGMTRDFALKIGAIAFFEKPSLKEMFNFLDSISPAA